MDRSSEDNQITFNYSIRPFEIALPKSERARLARDTQQGIDRAIGSKELNFVESIETVDPVELNANPELPPNWEFGALVRIAFDKAIVRMQRNYIEGEYQFVSASVVLYGERIPIKFATTLNIQANEATASGSIDLDNPDFCLETPSDDGEVAVLPLSYKDLVAVLDGLLAQSNEVESISKSYHSIEESLLAIAAMSTDRSTKREARYRFNDPHELGHAVVGIVQRYNHQSGIANPTANNHVITVENTLHLNDLDGISTTTYLLDAKGKNASAKTGVAYERVFIDDQLVESFERSAHNSIKKWQDVIGEKPQGTSRRKMRKTRFGSYITAGLNRINDTSNDETNELTTVELP